MTTLGRVLDPEALDASNGPVGRFAVDVPSSWRGRLVDVIAPRHVTCSRCDGGGCDSCKRSGAFKLGVDPAERAFRVHLPNSDDDALLLRIQDPFGEDVAPALLLLETRFGERTSEGVSLVDPLAPARRPRAAFGVVALVAAIAVLALLLALR